MLQIRERIKNFLSQCRRVITVASKPDKEELKTSIKITGIGIIIIGMIGFVISMIFQIMELL